MNCTPLSKHLLFHPALFRNFFYQPFIYFSYIPMRRNRITTIFHIIKISRFNIGFSNKIIAHSLYIVTMIHISQIINFFKSFFPQSIHNIRSCIPGFTRNVVNYFPQQCLYFFPLPHGHGSFRPIFFLRDLI